MGKQVGVWVDHQKAVIAILANEKETIRLITTKSEQQQQNSGDSPLNNRDGAQLISTDHSHQRIFMGELPFYYDAVVAYIQDAESIMIFGPSEATNELKTRLERSNLAGRIMSIAPADKMTSRQIVAKVREQIVE